MGLCVAGSNKAVFLSYAKQDAEAAGRICDALRAAGIEVWFDQSELRGGDAWDAAIRRQIKTCALMIPVISANTQGRAEGYFRLEWKLAVDRSHLMSHDRPFLVPVVVDQTAEDDERVPDKFREVQWTRLPGGETPPAFSARLLRLLEQATTVGGTAPAVTAAAAVRAPRYPSYWGASALAGDIAYAQGDYARAAELSQKSVAQMTEPELRDRVDGAIRLTLIASEARLGHAAKAKAAWADFTTTLPEVTSLTAVRKWMHASADLAEFEPLYEGLRIAGVSN
jgi:TIR domain